MNTKQKYASLLALAGSALFAFSAQAQLAQPLYEFNFNDVANGTNAANTGSQGGQAAMTWYVETGSIAREAANLRSASGLGVSGRAGDYAFNNSLATRMGGSGAVNAGTAGYGGMGQMSNGGAAMHGASSFTIAGWYNAHNSAGNSSTPGNYARLIEFGQGLGIWFQVDNGVTSLNLSMNVSTGGSSTNYQNTNSLFLTANQWTFFAFTYDQATATVALYGGSDATDVALIDSYEVSGAGTVNLNASGRHLTLANSNGNGHQRPFQGYLDNFRVWRDVDGENGALSREQLQFIRASDLANNPIPEPTTTALLIGAGVMALVVLKRRRRS